MPVRRIRCHPAAQDNLGRLAVERGPLVYCAESADNPSGAISLTIPPEAAFAEGTIEILGHRMVSLRSPALSVSADLRGVRSTLPAVATLIPYFAWCHRGAGEMQVWIPTSAESATPHCNVRVTASHCFASDTLTAALDGVLPKNSDDHDVRRMTWWDRKGTAEWIQYEFPKPETVTGCAVYWFDDTGRGACRVPASWKVQARDEAGNWTDIPAGYPVAKDAFCNAAFEKPIVTQALRLCVQLQPGVSGGVLEWRPLVP